MPCCILAYVLLPLVRFPLGIALDADVDVEAFGCRANGKICTEEFNFAVGNVSAAGGGVLHARGPGAYLVAVRHEPAWVGVAHTVWRVWPPALVLCCMRVKVSSTREMTLCVS
jgi:hypothetical protein